MRLFSRVLPVPVFVILLALILPPAVVGGLFLWAAVGDVPLVNVDFFPDEAGRPLGLREADTQSDKSGQDQSTKDGQGQEAPTATAISPNLRSEVVVGDAEFPVSLAFAPDGRLFYNELLTGNIRVVLPDGTLLPEPFAHLDIATSEPGPGRGGEWGLIGLAVDPDFESNHYVYVYFTKPVNEDVAQPTVMRFTDVANRGQEATVIIGDLPETLADRPGFHVAGNIHFGPDGHLYVSIGEYNLPTLTLDLRIPQGKILRVSKEDGAGVSDNPFANRSPFDTRIFAFGFRNPFDFAFHPETGELYVADNGPTTCDELNIVTIGQFYGWPGDLAPESCQSLPGIPAIYNFSRPEMRPEEPGAPPAPTGLEFVSGDVYPRLGDGLLACEVNTAFMRLLVLAGETQDIVVSDDVIVEDCHLSIAADPNGVIYYSNRNEIRRLVPQ